MIRMPIVAAVLLAAGTMLSLPVQIADAQIRIQPPQIRPLPPTTQPGLIIVPGNQGPTIVTPSQPGGRFLVPDTIQGVSVDQARVANHVIRPAHLNGVSSDNGLDDADANVPPRLASAATPGTGTVRPQPGTIVVQPPNISTRPGGITITPGGIRVQPGTARPPSGSPNFTGPTLPKLNIDKFGQDLHGALQASVTGYFMRLIQNGQTVYTLQWNWSQTPNDGGLGWEPNRNMHIASVSKLMTAIGMTRLLEEKNISPDTPIINFLPAYWQKGPNVNQITFRHLLTHRSGFSTGGSSSDFQTMKTNVAGGVGGVGGYDYENLNFGLGRILMAVINGNVAQSMFLQPPFQSLNDQLWDTITIDAYNQYMQTKVFAPAGVNSASLAHPGNGALAYAFPAGSGWNSGDLSTMAGGAGWHMTPNDVLRVMARFRRGGSIVSPADAQDMLADGFGIDRTINSPAGTLYEKNGLWRDGNGRTEQSVAYFLPGGQELVVFVNSPVGGNGSSLRNLVRDTYLANVE